MTNRHLKERTRHRGQKRVRSVCFNRTVQKPNPFNDETFVLEVTSRRVIQRSWEAAQRRAGRLTLAGGILISGVRTGHASPDSADRLARGSGAQLRPDALSGGRCWKKHPQATSLCRPRVQIHALGSCRQCTGSLTPDSDPEPRFPPRSVRPGSTSLFLKRLVLTELCLTSPSLQNDLPHSSRPIRVVTPLPSGCHPWVSERQLPIYCQVYTVISSHTGLEAACGAMWKETG